MRRILFLLLAPALALFAANFKLYLKDGSYQLVREYKVSGDKLSFYSIDRSDWEDVPVAIVDLKRTETEAAAKKATLAHEAKEVDDEAAAAAEQRREIMKIPQDAGVYRLLDGGELQIFKLEDAVLKGVKSRTALKVISPIPMSGKGSLEIQGEHAQIALKEPRPEFYVQVGRPDDAIAIVKLEPKGGVRVVEKVTIEAVVNIPEEQREAVEIFTKQLTDSGLYKVWPQADMPKGEYAVLDYNEGKIDARVFDFRIE